MSSRKIKQSLPGVQHESNAYMYFQEHELGIEIDLTTPDGTTVKDINISVGGNGNPIGLLTTLCQENGWEIFDLQEAEFIDLANPNTGSWIEFTQFRETVVRTYRKKWWQFWK